MKNSIFSSLVVFILISVLIGSCGEKQAGDGAIEHTLSNGFRIVMKENHASPMITSIVMVNAGSKFEADSTNGFTHFLEHLNFDGTETKTREDINEGIKNHGGYINAFTRKDATFYLVLMPTEFIDFGLDVQQDQLFGSVFPEDEYEKEQKVVTEEIRKDNDNINHRVESFNDSIVYAGTPYARTVLGSPRSIAEVSREAVMNYYKSQYTPENMLAIAIGDFNPDSMLALYEKYFGDKPRGGTGKELDINYTFPASDSIHYRQTDTELCHLNITYPAPHYTDEDFYAFEMLTKYLGADETSPLRKVLTGENPLIQSMNVYLDTKKEMTNMVVSVMTDNPDNIEEIVQLTNQVLGDLTTTPVPRDELERFMVKTKVDEYLLEERLHYWSFFKAPYLAVGGYDFAKGYIENLDKVESDDIQSAAKKYFADIEYVATAVVPEV
ncbi:MAG: hypothetical protein GF315_00290 [candidate division Zixibacteria bacterium]|nr:hypothetical protein [candidate division Zixibacteria bacterium]